MVEVPDTNVISDTYVVHTQDDYAEDLAALLPTGLAWPRDPDTNLMKTIHGMAGPWADVAIAANALLVVEDDPRLTVNMLPEWEESFGLPDECLSEPLTIADRHTALVQRMTMQGAQSRAFFIEQAAAIGYTITITEFSPFMVGVSHVGDTRGIYDPEDVTRYNWQIGPREMRFYWVVHVFTLRLSYFHVSASECGVDRLLTIGLATDLECLIRRYSPAHTQVIFDYSTLIGLNFQAPYDSAYLVLGII